MRDGGRHDAGAGLEGLLDFIELDTKATDLHLGIAAAAFLFFKNVGAEELELEDQYGEIYQAYRERVSRLLPLPSCAKN